MSRARRPNCKEGARVRFVPVNPREQQLYELRAAGFSWKRIGATVGYHPDWSIFLARRHALRTGAAWPPLKRKKGI